jgi:hypothetical protein
MATADDGVCATLYSACEVQVRVGGGSQIRIREETHYPFEDEIRLRLETERPEDFPLYLRIPAWCRAPRVAVNGRQLRVADGTGKFVRIEREWKNNDSVTVFLPREISVRRWQKNHDSVSVDYGPLTFSLKIGERYNALDSTQSAISDSSWQKGADRAQWPAYEILPTTPWNYGLVLKAGHPERSFKIRKRNWPKDDFPFVPESVPVLLEARARRIPEWKLDHFGLCAPLQDSPAYSKLPEEKVTLLPMGAARLRISAFPVASPDPAAHHWVAPR